jgi:hypothetical protein
MKISLILLASSLLLIIGCGGGKGSGSSGSGGGVTLTPEQTASKVTTTSSATEDGTNVCKCFEGAAKAPDKAKQKEIFGKCYDIAEGDIVSTKQIDQDTYMEEYYKIYDICYKKHEEIQYQ